MANLESIGILATLLMFFVSGVQKVRNPSFEQPRFTARTGIPSEMAVYVLYFVGVVELLASFIVAKDVVEDGKISRTSRMSLVFLAVFTTAATAIFYANPSQGIFKLRPFLSNLSTLGSILLALSILKTR